MTTNKDCLTINCPNCGYPTVGKYFGLYIPGAACANCSFKEGGKNFYTASKIPEPESGESVAAGRPIDPKEKEIDDFLAQLAVEWKKFPDQRFGQFIVNASGQDPFYVKNEEFLKFIKAFTSKK